MAPTDLSPLAGIEPRLRWLLPADLYAAVWVEPNTTHLERVYEHQRTLLRILHDYLPPTVATTPPRPGAVRYGWQEGTLMFTDLAGFTPLLEANASRGRSGAETLLGLLNSYFSEMLEIISKAGGDLLEFTGDALLAQFPADQRRRHTDRAVRAGLRMQRAMARFARIETPHGPLALGMRVGLHTGRVLSADVGTPRRMENVMLGNAVQLTKQAEGAGKVGRVCLTPAAHALVREQFRFEPGNEDHMLVVDDLDDRQLGEFDLAPVRRRTSAPLLLDRSLTGLVATIEEALNRTEPLASYLPRPILSLIVESASARSIRPEFPELTVVFVNLVGISAAVDGAAPEAIGGLVTSFSRIFALVNAAVEARGGVLKNVTYDRSGSNVLIYFGVPNAHTNDPVRAADTALAIRDAILASRDATGAVGSCQIGISQGPVFAAEIGETRGRREFNVLGDTVNTAARLMGRAAENQILITEPVREALGARFTSEPLGAIALKGKAAPQPLFALIGRADGGR